MTCKYLEKWGVRFLVMLSIGSTSSLAYSEQRFVLVMIEDITQSYLQISSVSKILDSKKECEELLIKRSLNAGSLIQRVEREVKVISREDFDKAQASGERLEAVEPERIDRVSEVISSSQGRGITDLRCLSLPEDN